jgi:hypothetical protein
MFSSPNNKNEKEKRTQLFKKVVDETYEKTSVKSRDNASLR